jgi:hypothetical protein
MMALASLNQPRELVATWREDARNLMWTEFVPVHRAEEVVREAERAGNVGRAAAVRKALEARRAKDPAACASGKNAQGGNGGNGGR